MVNSLGMNYSKSIISSIKKETFDHTVLLRYCAILSEEIEMNFWRMIYSQNIICSCFIENQKKKIILCYTVRRNRDEYFGYELSQKYYMFWFHWKSEKNLILCILDTVLYCAILCYTVHLGMNSPQNILCSSLIENQKKSHTVLYCAILCILDTVLYCGKK